MAPTVSGEYQTVNVRGGNQENTVSIDDQAISHLKALIVKSDPKLHSLITYLDDLRGGDDVHGCYAIHLNKAEFEGPWQQRYDRYFKRMAYNLRDKKLAPEVKLTGRELNTLADALKRGVMDASQFDRIRIYHQDNAYNASFAPSFDPDGHFFQWYAYGFKAFGTRLPQLPDDCFFENLDLNDTDVASLPKYLMVKQQLDVSLTPIKSLPETLVANRVAATRSNLECITPGAVIEGGFSAVQGAPIASMVDDPNIKQLLFPLNGESLQARWDACNAKIQAAKASRLEQDLYEADDWGDTVVKLTPEKESSAWQERYDPCLFDLDDSDSASLDSNISLVEHVALFLSVDEVNVLAEALTRDWIDERFFDDCYVFLDQNFRIPLKPVFSGTGRFVEWVTREVNVYGHESFDHLPKNLYVLEDMELTESGVTELPENLSVLGRLDSRCSSVAWVPDSLKASKFYLADSKVNVTACPHLSPVGEGYNQYHVTR